MDAKAILYQAYETAYGIHDYLDQARMETAMMPSQKRPLSSVAMHPAEDFTGTSEYRRMARLFAEKNVTAVFGLSWEEFLDMTPDKCEDILLICQERNNRQSKVDKQTTEAMAELEKAAQALRQ